MLKTFGILPSEKRVSTLHPVQWQWLALNILKDEEEDYKTKLDLVEYLASFWNSKAVQQIKRKRKFEEKGLTKEVIDKATEAMLEVISGKKN